MSCFEINVSNIFSLGNLDFCQLMSHKFSSFCATGKAEGILYEDDGDGFGFKHGKYLLTRYAAHRLSSESGNNGGEVVIRIAHTEGQSSRPNRHLHVRLLLGHSTQVCGFAKHRIFGDC